MVHRRRGGHLALRLVGRSVAPLARFRAAGGWPLSWPRRPWPCPAPTSRVRPPWALAARRESPTGRPDAATARRHYEAQIEVAEGAGDDAGIADAYFNFGHLASHRRWRLRQSGWPTSTRSWSAIEPLGTSVAQPEPSGVEPHLLMEREGRRDARRRLRRCRSARSPSATPSYAYSRSGSMAWGFQLGDLAEAARWAIQSLRRLVRHARPRGHDDLPADRRASSRSRSA